MFSSALFRRGRRCAASFEGIESLEQRLALSTIHWTGAGDGQTLNNRCNWECGRLPGIYDTAIIDVAGSPQIKLTSGSFRVKTFIQAESLTVTGGTLEVGSGGMTLSGSMNMAGGQFEGCGLLGVRGSLNWTAGKIIGSGDIDVAPGGRFDVDGATPLNLGRDVNNRGTMIWHDGDIDGSDGDGNSIVNRAGALFKGLGDGRFRSLNGTGSFDNQGTFVRDSQGHSRFLVPFANSGTLNVAAGILELWAGGSNAGVRNVAAGAVLHYFGNFTHGAGSTLEGGGETYWQGGTHTITAAWSMNSYLFLVGTTVTGAADWTIDGVLGWSHGRMEGTGGTIIGPTGKIEIRTDGQHDLARDIQNNGVLLWNRGELRFDGATVTNPAGHTFYVCADATAVNGSGVNRIVNEGELRKQLPTDLGFGGVTLDNTGLVMVRNGSLSLDDGAVAQLSGGTLAAGEWFVLGTARLGFSGAPITTVGSGATLTRFGRQAGLDALGSLTRNDGTIRLYGGGSLDIAPLGGTFTNAGTMFLNNSTALRVDGNFAQTATGTLSIGLGAWNMYSTGRVISAQGVALDGSVSVRLELGYSPMPGNQYELMVGASVTGQFVIVEAESGPTPQLVYLPGRVMLVYV